MKNFKITEWNHKGFEEILCSSGAASICREQADRIRENANAELISRNTEGYASDGKIVKAYGSNRWMFFVHTTDSATMYAEAEDNALSKAVN